jgi:hypothetical protein
MKNKRGVSAVVATVLIILITVAAVGIIWVAVIPLIRDKVASSDICLSADLSIDSSGGWTCHDLDQNLTKIRVKRGSSDSEIVGVEFYFDKSGNTETFIRNLSIGKNGAKVYSFSDIEIVDEVKIAPIVKIGDTEEVCSISSSIKIKTCKFASGGNGLEEDCIQDVDCDDGNDCTSGEKRICNEGVLGLCGGGDEVVEGTSCLDEGVCDGNGVCVVPECINDGDCDTNEYCWNEICETIPIIPLADLSFWWKFEDSWEDSIAGKVGTPYSSAHFEPGKVGRAASFDGVDDYVSVDNFLIPSTVSLSAWFKQTDLSDFIGGKYAIFGSLESRHSQEDYFGLWLQQSGLKVVGSTSVSGTWTTVAAFGEDNSIDENWHHAVFVMDNTNLKLYVDGVLQEEKVVSVNPSFTAGGTEIGRSNHSTPMYFNGEIDELMIYERVLGEGDVFDIYINQSKS